MSREKLYGTKSAAAMRSLVDLARKCTDDQLAELFRHVAVESAATAAQAAVRALENESALQRNAATALVDVVKLLNEVDSLPDFLSGRGL